MIGLFRWRWLCTGIAQGSRNYARGWTDACRSDGEVDHRSGLVLFQHWVRRVDVVTGALSFTHCVPRSLGTSSRTA